MRKIEDLSLEECRTLIGAIQEILYMELADDGEGWVLNPDKEWDETIGEDVAYNFERFDLIPDELTPLPYDADSKEQEIMDFIMKEWDEEHMGILPNSDSKARRAFEQYYREHNIPLPWTTIKETEESSNAD